MKRLNPNMLSVEYRRPVTPTVPIYPRKYTLTHSDTTGELFLTIGPTYAEDKVTSARDEVRGKWQCEDGQYFFYLTVWVNRGGSLLKAAVRNRIFRRELPLAIEAICFADQDFFRTHPALDQAPIYIHFQSSYSIFDSTEYWEVPADYN
jgi:hypothetical protein